MPTFSHKTADAERKLRVYIDTSVPNHLFADDRPDWMAITWRLWDRLAVGECEIFVSDVFFEELERCPEPKLGKMYGQLNSIEFERLTKTDEVVSLATRYIQSGVLKKKDYDDCLHIAHAVINGCDVILSWNFGDIVNDSTRYGVKVVNATSRYSEIAIVSPEQFLDGWQ